MSEEKNTGAMPEAEAIKIPELLEYQTGAVVSRTLVKNSSGTVTLFAFDKGQGLSEHSAPFDALVMVQDGECEIKIGGKPIKTKAGQSVLMPANIPHALTATKKFKMLLVMVRGK